MGPVKEFSAYRIRDIERNLSLAGFQPLDVMVAGVTGAGKSTTLNSFFQRTVAAVGNGADPETMTVGDYSLNKYFRIWDTPGLGDSVKQDEIHKAKMIELLDKTWGNHLYKFIDLALVIIEGANKDMGTTYTLLNDVIVPHIQRDRILVAINQADLAMKGRHWDPVTKQPDAQLLSYLDEQASSIQRRVKEATGVNIYQPVYYSAEYGYNIEKLFDFMIDHMPRERRPVK